MTSSVSFGRKPSVLKHAELGIAVRIPNIATTVDASFTDQVPVTTRAEEVNLQKIYAAEWADLQEQVRSEGVKQAEVEVAKLLQLKEAEFNKSIAKQLEEHQEKLTSQYQNLEVLLEALDQERKNMTHSLEPVIARLTTNVIHRVIGTHAETHNLILSLVKQAIEEYEVSGSIKVRIAPSDSQIILDSTTVINYSENINFIADSGLQAGECILEFEGGAIDIGLPQQLKSIQDVLLGTNP